MYYSHYQEISLKEILLSFIVIALSMTIALLCFQPIFNGRLERQTKFLQAMQIVDNSELFVYGKETNVGDILANGEFSSLDPQGMEELTNQYSIIDRVTERYTMHINYNTVCDSEGENCHTEIEITYSWDRVGSVSKVSKEFEFLGAVFSSEQLSYIPTTVITSLESNVHEQYKPLVRYMYLYPNGMGNHVGNIRYYYHVVPLKFRGTMFVSFVENKELNPLTEKGRIPIYYGETIDNVIYSQEKMTNFIRWIYYIIWFLVTASVYYYLAYEFLEIY